MSSFRNHRRPARPTSRRPRPRLEALEDRTTPAQFFVNTLASTFDHSDGLLGLREAIDAVNNNSLSQLSAEEQAHVSTALDPLGTNDRIEFQVAGTIGLEQQLTLSRDVTIQGPGDTLLTVSGQDTCQVFVVQTGAHAALGDLTIAHGKGNGGGGISNQGMATLTNCTLSGNYAGIGGGIFNYSGTATLDHCTLSGNSAGIGGGIYNSDGTLQLANCTLSDNSANYGDGIGGGIYNYFGTATLANCTLSGNSASGVGGGGGGISNDGTATLANCTLSGNSASGVGGGGGIYNAGTATLANCTLAGNSADVGGGISNDGTATLANCTLSGNSATGGGGIYNAGTATLANCTLSGNSATVGGGIYNYSQCTVTLNNSIVANSVTGGDIYNPGTLQGSHNLVGDGSGLPGWLSGDPQLGPLQDNGGPTQTMALPPGSPAIDAGDNALVPAGVTTDQRGGNRFVSGVTDLGALEYWPTELAGAIVSAGPDISATEGAGTGPVVVATFTADPGHMDFSATISWGDGDTGPSTVGYDAGTGTYTVTGSHTYVEEGAYAVSVGVTAADYSTASTSLAATVADAALTAGALTPPVATEGVSTGDEVLFHFTDANPNAAADYTAVVSWGDGASDSSAAANPVVRVVVNPAGGFDVRGGHTYAEETSGLTPPSAIRRRTSGRQSHLRRAAHRPDLLGHGL
jgi:hypothetical protein